MPPPSAPPAAPAIFDRALLRARLARAIQRGGEDFLLARAADDLIDRLAPVQRAFTSILDIGTPRGDAALRLAVTYPAAAITRAALLDDGVRGRWRSVRADEEALPFAAGAFDLATSLLSLHAVNDLPGALVQIRRALRPDGLLLACLLGGQSLHELRTVLTAAESELSGGVAPRVAPFGDLRDLGGLLQRTGFALPVTDTEALTVRYASLDGLVADLRAMGATNVLATRSRRPLARRVLRRAAALYAERFADADGRLRATFELVWLSGWSPHKSQGKPARRGSATVSLADALATFRTSREPS